MGLRRRNVTVESMDTMLDEIRHMQAWFAKAFPESEDPVVRNAVKRLLQTRIALENLRHEASEANKKPAA